MSAEHDAEQKAGRKLAVAVAMLLFTSHRLPGVRGYELRRRLGKNYLKIIDMLNRRLNPIGLRVKIVFEGRGDKEHGQEDFDKARFFITLNEPLTLSDIVAAGWRIDEVAILSATLALLYPRGGRATYGEVMELLEAKFPKWRVESALEKFIRRGYLYKDEDNILHIGWRTYAEIDQRELAKAITELHQQTSGKDSEEPSSQPL